MRNGFGRGRKERREAAPVERGKLERIGRLKLRQSG